VLIKGYLGKISVLINALSVRKRLILLRKKHNKPFDKVNCTGFVGKIEK